MILSIIGRLKTRQPFRGPALIAAAGSLAGGMAAQAIMGKPVPPGPDTSVPGVSSATIQKATKSDPGVKIAQVDPTGALNYFQQAANSYNNSALQGINLYQNSMQQAIDSVNTKTDNANKQLDTIAKQGTAASKQYMQMLGLTPPSDVATSGILDQVKSFGSEYSDIADQIKANEGLTDPTQRSAARDALTNQITQSSQNLSASELQSVKDAAVQAAGAAPVKPISKMDNSGDPRVVAKTDPTEIAQDQAKLDAQYQQDLNSYYSKLQTATNQAITQATLAKQSQGKDLISNYSSLYGNDVAQGYTGDQVTKQLENTPGYQFQLGQGNQAVARAGAAGGLLGSGNTLTAAQTFGQGLAQNTYQNYLSNLSPLIASGNTATGQEATNTVNQGNSLAQLYGNLGSGLLSAYQNIGQAYNNAYTNAGQTTYNAAIANMNAQNDAIKQKNQQNFQAQQNANSNQLQAGYLNLANNQFSYQVAQGQQAGQAFAQSTAGNSGNNSSGAGSGYPYYNNQSAAWYV